MSEIVAVRLAHAQRPATPCRPRHAIGSRSRDREHVHAVIEGLDEDLELAVAVEIVDGRSGRRPIAVSVIAWIGKHYIMQEAAVGTQYHQITGVGHIRIPVCGKHDLRRAVLVEIGYGGLGCIHHCLAMHEVEPPDLHRIGRIGADITVVQGNDDLRATVTLDIDRGRCRDAIGWVPSGDRYWSLPLWAGLPTPPCAWLTGSHRHGRPPEP